MSYDTHGQSPLLCLTAKEKSLMRDRFTEAERIGKHNAQTMNPQMIAEFQTMSPHKQAEHSLRVSFAALKKDRLATLNARRALNGLPPVESYAKG